MRYELRWNGRLVGDSGSEEVTWGTGWVAVEQVGPGLERKVMVGV